jgi:hypothetical protein
VVDKPAIGTGSITDDLAQYRDEVRRIYALVERPEEMNATLGLYRTIDQDVRANETISEVIRSKFARFAVISLHFNEGSGIRFNSEDDIRSLRHRSAETFVTAHPLFVGRQRFVESILLEVHLE